MHSVALRSDGSVWSWGRNDQGQLGDGSQVSRSAPVKLTGFGGVISVAAGSEYSLALKNDGTVWAWGRNVYGALGDGTSTNRLVPTQVSGLSNVVKIAAGEYHNIALKSDGTVWTWGQNSSGQLGDGTVLSRNVPVQVTSLSGVASIAAGMDHTLAVKTDGTVWSWGGNLFGYLGDGTVTRRTAPVQLLSLSGVVSVAAGQYHSAAVKSDGTLWTWGYNNYGQLGDGSTSTRTSPVQVASISGAVSVAAGAYCSAAVKADGTAWAWGWNNYGRLGDGTTTNRSLPVQIAGLSGIVSLSTKLFHGIAEKSDGTILTWGGNAAGQLGNGRVGIRAKAEQIVALKDIISIEAGRSHAAAVGDDGKVWTWGLNLFGQLGDGSNTSRAIPASIVGLTGAVSVAAGEYHMVVGKSDGSAWCWGYGGDGQLGNGSNSSQVAPVQVTGLTGTVSVAAGTSHTVAQKSDGTAWAWGNNSNGQLGDGTTTYRSAPVQASGLSGVTSVSAGAFHTVAVKNDATVWGWGSNSSGQLGDGSTTRRTAPVQVSGMSNALSVAAGGNFTIALKNDGTVWSWGANNSGQLGDGSLVNRITPVQVSGLTGVVAIAAGDRHAVAVKSDGTVWAWGQNDYSQLGEGSTTNRPTPQRVGGIPEGLAGKVAAGYFSSYLAKPDGTLMGWGNGGEGLFANAFPEFHVEASQVLGFHRTLPIPSVTLAASPGAVVPVGKSANLQATVDLSSGSAESVFFYADGIWLGEDHSSPFTFSYQPSTWGDLSVNAIAVSSAGVFSAPAYLTFETPCPPDTDSDGLPDAWELAQFGDLDENGPGDPDNDGLTNFEELALGTDPEVADATPLDSDGDGLPDAYEIAHGLQTAVDDSLEDADGDRFPNIFEYKNGSSSSDHASRPRIDLVVDKARGGDDPDDNIFKTVTSAAEFAIYGGGGGAGPRPYQTIFIKAGTYVENLYLTNVPILVLGELGAPEGPVVLSSNVDGNFTVYMDRVAVLDGITITHAPGTTGRGVICLYYPMDPMGGDPSWLKQRRLINCVIRDNTGYAGGGFEVVGADLTLAHCTVSGNTSDTSQGPGANVWTGNLILRNSIVWGNVNLAGDPAARQIWVQPGAALNVSAACPSMIGDVNTGSVPGWIDAGDPSLVPGGWLAADSDAIAAAGPITGSPVLLDLNGEPRDATAPDIGADEYLDENSIADGDGVPDWAEGADDNDGVSAYDEYNVHGTHPLIADTDGDGVSDGDELANGLNPLANEDNDQDGMSDAWEFIHGLDWLVDDTLDDKDGDRIPNIFEFIHGTSASDSGAFPTATLEVNPATGGNDPGDDVHATIQAALGAAAVRDEDGDGFADPYQIILIRGGVYAENVNVAGAPVLLLGELGSTSGPVEIRSSLSGAALTMSSASVADGLVITHESGVTGSGLVVNGPSWGDPLVRRRFVNCIIRGNTAANSGGISATSCKLDLVHCTVTGNVSTSLWPGIRLSATTLNLINSLVAGNNGQPTTVNKQIAVASGSVIATFAESPSLIGDLPSSPAAGWKFVRNPGLTSTGFIVDAYSAVVNSGGASASTAVLYDIQGHLRSVGGTPDVGADEFIPAYSDGPEQEPLPDLTVDSDGDGIPDQWELANSLDPEVPNPASDLQDYLNESLNQGGLIIHTPLQ